MNGPVLKRVERGQVRARRQGAFDAETLSQAQEIVDDVRRRGADALRAYGARLDGLTPEEPLVRERAELEAAVAELAVERRDLLERCADRIRRFADAQRGCLTDLSYEIPGGRTGHTVLPLERAGCYVPGGRYPLVSSMLMTVVTARAAGVERVWAASPRPSAVMCAAAGVAGADALLTAGGAHAVAALAYGAGPVPACDVVVGPGNRWVTAAKYVVSADVRIDMLAGPSELLVFADDSADPVLVAADLLAQAEHDVDARPILVTTCPSLLDDVDRELARQLERLPARGTAAEALAGGFAVCVRDVEEAIVVCNEIAPEHLELHVRDVDEVVPKIRRCGCLFIGSGSPEALGDYVAGPNHTLPTGGTARFASGLSVQNFLRQQTWIRYDAAGGAEALLEDAAAVARLEKLEAHARSAELRRGNARGA